MSPCLLIFFSVILLSSFTGQAVFAQSSNAEVRIPLGASDSECAKTKECFIPFEVTIATGSTVTWVNNDDTPHTVTAGDLKKDVDKIGMDYPNGFSSPLLKPGESWSFTFNKAGTYPYFSMVGLWMTGVIIVEGEAVQDTKEDIIPKDSVESKPTTIQEAYIFLDELPPMTISQGDPIFITGELITPDGDPIAEKKVSIETIDINGESFVSTTTTDEDGYFVTEAYFFVTGESFAAAKFEGDDKYTSAESSILIDVTVNTPETQMQPSEEEPSSGFELPEIGGGCLIATATFGSELSPQVQMLREIRDNTVLSTSSGTSFMAAFNALYYSFSPTVADLERQNPVFKEMIKVTITPLISSLSLLQYVDVDSEQEMLGYGIGIILLNTGMYFVAPAIFILKIKSILRQNQK